MADQCVPVSSHVTVKIEQKSSLSKNCSVTFKAKMKHHHEDEKESNTSNGLGLKRKRRRKGIPAKQKWEIISSPVMPNIKQAHKKAKRRPAVKDKRREIHRQNERFRHQSLNMAIKDLSMLVPHSKHHRTAVKHHVVQKTGQYLQFLNNQVTLMCSQLKINKRATKNCFSFNRPTIATFDHVENRHPAGRAITLSSVEGLLHNMHIENRHYSKQELNKQDKNLKLMRENKPPLPYLLEARKMPDSMCMSGNYLESSQGSSQLASPTPGDFQMNREPVRAGYLGDVEHSQSSVSDFSEESSSFDMAELVTTSTTTNSDSSEGTFSSSATSPSNMSDISEVMPFLTDQEATMRNVEKLQFVEGPPKLIFDSNTKQVLQHVGWVNSSVLQRRTASCKVLGTVCNFSTQSVDKNSSLKSGDERNQSCSSSKDLKDDSTQSIQGASQSQPMVKDGDVSTQRSWINGYQLFVKVNNPHFKQAWPHLQGQDISHLLAQAWNDLPDDVKKIYSDKACTWNQQHKKIQEQVPEQ